MLRGGKLLRSRLCETLASSRQWHARFGDLIADERQPLPYGRGSDLQRYRLLACATQSIRTGY